MAGSSVAPQNYGAFLAGKACEFRFEIALGLVLVVAGMANATEIYDDLHLAAQFRLSVQENGIAGTLLTLFFNLDLGSGEYRLYGLSRILHFTLWEIVGTRAWVYGGFIAAAQFASGLGIRRLLTVSRVDRFQAWAVTLVWMLSPFAVTTCFHHYSYLLLPYELAIACAVVLQKELEADARDWRRYLAIALLAFTVANTGEAHIPAALVILAFVTFVTPSLQSKRSRFAVLALSATVIVVSVLLHRLWWSAHVSHSETQRYILAIPDLATVLARTSQFLSSLPLGLETQLDAMFAFAGYRVLVMVAFAVALGFLVWCKRSRVDETSIRGLELPAALLLVAVAGIVTVWAVSVFSAQVYGVYPRRYGYIPNTVVAMAIVGLVAAPAVRRFAGRAPAYGGVLLVGWLWLILVVGCLPTIRRQDQKVWKTIAQAVREKPDTVVLFASSKNYYDKWSLSIIAAGLRGNDFPETFESPLSHCILESQYASVVLGARYAACSFDTVDSAQVRLAGLGGRDMQYTIAPIVVSPDSIVVVADVGLHPHDWRSRQFGATVFTKWPDFLGSLAAHGADVVTGWEVFRHFPDPEQVAIDVGDPVGTADSLPDKLYSEPAQGSGPVVNYGVEAGDDSIYAPPHGGPFAWWLTNRNGTFTYRIDFSDRTPRTVALDWLDYWHTTGGGGARRMILDAAADDQWYRVGIIDPAAEAGDTPLVLKLPTGGAKTFRIRLRPASGATDVPFLAGIRILPAKP